MKLQPFRIMLNNWAFCTVIAMAFSGTVAGEVVIERGATDTPNIHLLSADEGDLVRSQPKSSAFASGTAFVPSNAINSRANVGVIAGSVADDVLASGAATSPASLNTHAIAGWISIVSVVLFFALTTIVSIFLISRAPVMNDDDKRGYRVEGPWPTKLSRESESRRHRPGQRLKTPRKPRKKTGAFTADLDFTPRRST